MRKAGSGSTTVAVVIPKTRADNLEWLQEYLEAQLVQGSMVVLPVTNIIIHDSPDTTPVIYSMSKWPEKDLLVPHASRGREASAYLSYILDYYDNLPPYSIFIHAGEEQRHNDLFGAKTKTVLENLRLEAVEAKGYINLRCLHSPGCPSHVHPNNPTQKDFKSRDPRAFFQ